MGKIYFSSDLHFGHNKDFLYEPRGFNSIEEHDKKVLENIKNTITDEDDFYILGDLMLEDNEYGLKLLAQIPGKIHIILGNHCTNTRIDIYNALPKVVQICYATRIKYKKASFYLSHYPTLCGNYDDGPWYKNMINLCGHIHTQDKFLDFDKGLIYHVELDAHNCFPVEIEEIIEDIKKKREEISNEK